MKKSKIKPNIVILAVGRCGTSALAGGLRAGGWHFEGEEPHVSLDDGQKKWVPGYLNGVKGKGNYKNVLTLPIILEKGETPILMTRKLREHARASQYGLMNDKTLDYWKKVIKDYNKEAMKLNPIVIKFEDLMSNPRKVFEMFNVDVDKAVAWIKPEVSNFYKS